MGTFIEARYVITPKGPDGDVPIRELLDHLYDRYPRTADGRNPNITTTLDDDTIVRVSVDAQDPLRELVSELDEIIIDNSFRIEGYDRMKVLGYAARRPSLRVGGFEPSTSRL